MNSEMTSIVDEKQMETTNYKSNRKIYNRDDFFRYYYCPQEAPDYLKEFQYLYNNFTDDNWCKKPIPKFEEIPETTKGKCTYPNSKLKGRQRTLSNQSNENYTESPDNFTKQRSFTGSNGKFNRYGNSPKEMLSTEDIKIEANTKFINSDDFVDNSEAQWHKVESRPMRSFNSSKPYAQSIHVTENHWKKWTKDTNQPTDKTRQLPNASFGRQERSGGNVWVRRNDNDSRQRNVKGYGRHSVSKSGDQTEDIWQDDWDTEMKSEIAKDVDDLNLDSFEFPKSSVLPITPPPLESERKTPILNQQADSPNSRFDLWYYRDLSDIERGPYSSENMANWFATGYFNPSTFVRRSCDERFLLLAEYRALYGRIPFTAGPAVPQIHANTPIEIDVKQLLIGVELSLIQKVISCATTLPTIVQPQMVHNNPLKVDENKQISSNAVEMMAILEEKRILEEGRAELERERERMVQEQVQWRERIEAELKAKMDEMILQQSLVNSVNVEAANATVNSQTPPEVPMNISQPVEKEACHRFVETMVIVEQRETIELPVEPVIPMDITTTTTKPISTKDKWEIDTELLPQTMPNTNEGNLWFSKKEQKQQKQQKKAQLQENKSSKEEKEIVQLPEAKHPEQPTDSRISFISRETMDMAKKESVVESRGRPIRIELDNQRNESFAASTGLRNVTTNSTNTILQTPTKSLLEIQAEEFEKEKKEKQSKKILVVDEAEVKGKPVSWNQSLLSPISTLPTAAKSLLEIQAEESAKEKRQQRLQNVAVAQAAEANKVSSFKESLLKSAKVTKPPSIPVGKSIWDMVPTEAPTAKPLPTVEVPEPKKNVAVKSTANNPKESKPKPAVDTDADLLTDWCVKKLAKFSDKFDVYTVSELLKLVPNDEVMELALQLLDDSNFTSSFAVEFVNKRQELADRQTENNSWHTVKKPITAATPVNNATKAKTAKSKSKKKMVVIDTKFR